MSYPKSRNVLSPLILMEIVFQAVWCFVCCSFRGRVQIFLFGPFECHSCAKPFGRGTELNTALVWRVVTNTDFFTNIYCRTRRDQHNFVINIFNGFVVRTLRVRHWFLVKIDKSASLTCCSGKTLIFSDIPYTL